MPSEFIPAATQKLSSSGAGPMNDELSGVKLSGPVNSLRMPTSFRIGSGSIAASRNGPSRSQSLAISPKLKSPGTPSTFHGAPSGSNNPTISPPVSSR
jgi:hypothetical protein